jgi:hypothetical protein
LQFEPRLPRYPSESGLSSVRTSSFGTAVSEVWRREHVSTPLVRPSASLSPGQRRNRPSEVLLHIFDKPAHLALERESHRTLILTGEYVLILQSGKPLGMSCWRGLFLLKNPFAFDETEFECQAEQDGVLAWLTPKGDSLRLFYFAKPPDLGADLHDVEGLRAFYRRAARQAGFGVLEIEACVIDGCIAVRTLFKVSQEPRGRSYVGALTFPFPTFSFVFKVESRECGITGVRDSFVLAKQLSTRESTTDIKSGQLIGWLDDPYDSSEVGTMTRNIAECPEYDLQFPDHPLSRARWVLDHLQCTVLTDETLKLQPKFSRNR